MTDSVIKPETTSKPQESRTIRNFFRRVIAIPEVGVLIPSWVSSSYSI